MTRPHSPALDAILGRPHQVLDHGFVRVIDYMGNDAAICQAARVSYGAGTKSISDDRSLIRYLMRHWHTTPSEMCEIKLHIKTPIYVARQWLRHRTPSVNEVSGRYSEIKDEFQIPPMHDIRTQSTNNKQGSGENLTGSDAMLSKLWIERNSAACFDVYKNQLELGVSREQARIVLPLNTYTEFYWKADLHNLFHFLRLRADPHAQAEIRAYADVICDIVAKWVPDSWDAFCDYRLHAASLSAQATEVLKARLAGEIVTQETSGMGAREWREFVEVWGE